MLSERDDPREMLPAATMRNLLTVLLLLAVAGGGWWLLRERGVDPPDVAGLPAVSAGDDAEPGGATPVEPAGAVQGRAAAKANPPPLAPVRPVDLADHVTACLQVLDLSDQHNVAGAVVYRFREGAEEPPLAYSDDRGLVALPLLEPAQLMVAKPGYLLRLAPTRPGSSADEPQVVSLVPDAYGHRCALRFRQPGDRAPGEVFARFRPQREGQGDQALPEGVRSGSEVVRRAWQEHLMLAAYRAIPELHVQLGLRNAGFVHRLAADDEVVFVESGPFEVEAATLDGYVARVPFDTEQLGRRPLLVQLQPGGAIRGVVRSSSGASIEGALVTVRDGEPLRLQAHSAADGAFAIGPLAPGVRALEIRHRDHGMIQAGPFEVGTAGASVTMPDLPATAIRGRVVTAGQRQPLPGVRVTAMGAAGELAAADTDEDGFFTLDARGNGSLRLGAGALGFLTHARLVDPGAAPIEIELWPADIEKRRQSGLTGLVTGRAVDAQGFGVAGVALRLQPAAGAGAATLGQRILSGGPESFPQTVTTASDGSFRFETAVAGAVTIRALAAGADPAGVQVVVELGKSVDEVRVPVRRPK